VTSASEGRVVGALILFLAVLVIIILSFVAVKLNAKRSINYSSLLNTFRNPLSHTPHHRRHRHKPTAPHNEFAVLSTQESDDSDSDPDIVHPMAQFREHTRRPPRKEESVSSLEDPLA
jgi:hypothetical protein